MRALVIYDLSGRIWNIVYGADEEPNGLLCMWVDVPNGMNLISIDTSDPENHTPVFNTKEENTEIKILQDKVNKIEETLNPTFNGEEASLEELKNHMLQTFSEECTRLIYDGQEVETSKGKYQFSFNHNDQINLKEVFDLAYMSGLNMPYHADKVDCTMWTALDIIKIYGSNVSMKTYHTTYCNLLNNICRAATSKEEIYVLYYGMKLPDEQNKILSDIMNDASQIFEKVISDYISKFGIEDSDIPVVPKEPESSTDTDKTKENNVDNASSDVNDDAQDNIEITDDGSLENENVLDTEEE